jgi:PAS domain S-box-containing protein
VADQKSLVLILTRELADKLASAVFVVDADGTLLFFNEAAEEILGRTFAEAGLMSLSEWTTAFFPSDPEGDLPPEELPLVVALQERRPSHRRFRIQGLDGQERHIAVTAFPLFASRDDCVGAAAIFWEHPGESGTVGSAEGG